MTPNTINPHPIAVHEAWRNVRVEVPEPLTDVLAVCWQEEEPIIQMAFRDREGIWWLTGADHLKVVVTDWMPCVALPEYLASCHSDLAKSDQQTVWV